MRSRQARDTAPCAHHRQGFPCCTHSPARTCRRQYPGGDDRPFSFAPHWAVPVAGSLPRDLGVGLRIAIF